MAVALCFDGTPRAKFEAMDEVPVLEKARPGQELGAVDLDGFFGVHPKMAPLAELFRQHPTMAGFILDEPKAFNIDTSPMAVAALGAALGEAHGSIDVG
mgnify:CR=1 FL=1